MERDRAPAMRSALGRRLAAPRLAVLLLAFAACRVPETAPPGPFVAMSCNVRYGTADDGPDRWPNRRDALAAQIAAAAPAILGVQEALGFQLDFLAERLPHHRRFGQGREGGARGEHAALFVDARRFAVVASGDFWLSETPDVVGSVGWDATLPRICTWAHVRDLGSGRELHVWNVHFDHRGADARLRSAELLARRLAATAGPHIVLGDLNAGEDSAPLAVLRAAGLRDTFREVHPDAIDVGTFHGFRGSRGGAKIDYVLAGPGLRTAAASILAEPGPNGRWPSDHHLVVAELRW